MALDLLHDGGAGNRTRVRPDSASRSTRLAPFVIEGGEEGAPHQPQRAVFSVSRNAPQQTYGKLDSSSSGMGDPSYIPHPDGLRLLRRQGLLTGRGSRELNLASTRHRVVSQETKNTK